MARVLVVAALLAGCAESPVDEARRRRDGGGAELAPDLGGPPGTCDDGRPCGFREVCYAGRCIPDRGRCPLDGECQNDSYCDCDSRGGGPDPCLGICLPWGVGPRGDHDDHCEALGFSDSEFLAPQRRCAWTGGDVMVAPVVGDLDGDGRPEITFTTVGGGLVSIHGHDCSVYFQRNAMFANNGESHLAIADLDRDGRPEIIGVDAAGLPVVLNAEGDRIAAGTEPIMPPGWGGPAIADLDNHAPPEIVIGPTALGYGIGTGTLRRLWAHARPGGPFGLLALAADLDGDRRPEVITTGAIFDGVTGAEETPATLRGALDPDTQFAVADFNNDRRPDLVLIEYSGPRSIVSVFDLAGSAYILGPWTFGERIGGPPTVADFDADGQPEFGVAGAEHYFVFDVECDADVKPAKCDIDGRGLLWQKPIRDWSSAVTGSSVFDFNGDGVPEVVYRDECWLRVYGGRDGRTLFATAVTSLTGFDLPVIADVNRDGHAEIVVSADARQRDCDGQPEADTLAPFTGASRGVIVFQDPMERWMPSRGVWNQHSYHITNVDDDLTVPPFETDNWLAYNNYRQNVQGATIGMPRAAPDFTAAPFTGIDGSSPDCARRWTLHATICNRGAAGAPPRITGTFYDMDPRKPRARPICTAHTTAPLVPGACEPVTCDWPRPPQTPVDLWFRANDDGEAHTPYPECDPGDNLLFLPDAVCMRLP